MERLEAFKNITDHLNLTNYKALIADIKLVHAYLRKKQPGDFWQNKGQRRLTIAKMKRSWAAKPKSKISVTDRRTGATTECKDYEAVSRITGYTPNSVRCYLSRGKGTWHLEKDDEIMTIERMASWK